MEANGENGATGAPGTHMPQGLSPFTHNLAALMKREVRTLSPQDSVGKAARVICGSGVGSLVVADGDAPIGILTKSDLVARVLVPDLPHDTPVSEVATANLITIEEERPIFDALLLMITHDIVHVVVTRNGALAGIISERDWLTFQQRHPAALLREIGAVGSIEELADLRGHIMRVVRNMFSNEGDARALTALVTEINDRVTQRVLRLCLDAEHGADGLKLATFAWVAFGSEGRGEQTLSTDQDNGIIFADVPKGELEATRAALMRYAERVVNGLEVCGFPRCKGNVMATNPELCLSLMEWKRKFSGYLDTPVPEALLNASIQFDLRFVYGKAPLVNALWDHLRACAPGARLFMRHLAGQVVMGRPPVDSMRWKLGKWFGMSPPPVDLKLNALGPMVAAARVLALDGGITATGTISRLEAARDKGLLPAGLAEAALDAYGHLMLLRVRQHFRQQNAGEEPNNILHQDTMNSLERRFLEGALRTVSSLQDEVFHKYGGVQPN